MPDITNIYLKLDTEKLGKIKGGSTQKGHEGDIEIVNVSHSIISPRDAATGHATGKRQHRPFSLTKEADMSTPLLYNLLVQNVLIRSAQLFFYGQQPSRLPGIAGAEQNFYTITLQNAFLSQIILSELIDDTGNKPDKLVENISLVYEKIQWKWQDGGVQAEDQWTNTAPSH